MSDDDTGGGVCPECYKVWSEGHFQCSCGADLCRAMVCPSCGWETADPGEEATVVLDMATCPRCTVGLEPAEEHPPDPDRRGPPAENTADPDNDWDWNPTMRAGPGGPVLDPETGREVDGS